jgi:hypothetical protein
VEALHATLAELDREAYAAKSIWARRKSLGLQVVKGKAQVAAATVERDAAKVRREAVVRAHADSEQALCDAEHSLTSVIDDWDKVQSEVEAREAEERADIIVDRGGASTDVSSWTFEDLERVAPQVLVRLSAARAERDARLLPRIDIIAPARKAERGHQRPTSDSSELVPDSPGASRSPRVRRALRRRSASRPPPHGAEDGADQGGVQQVATPLGGHASFGPAKGRAKETARFDFFGGSAVAAASAVSGALAASPLPDRAASPERCVEVIGVPASFGPAKSSAKDTARFEPFGGPAVVPALAAGGNLAACPVHDPANAAPLFHKGAACGDGRQ